MSGAATAPAAAAAAAAAAAVPVPLALQSKNFSEPERRGRLGVHTVGLRCAELGYIFREQSTSDIGIDAQIEIVCTPQNLHCGVQIKYRSGKSKLTLEYLHCAYWSTYPMPVVIILVEDSSVRFTMASPLMDKFRRGSVSFTVTENLLEPFDGPTFLARLKAEANSARSSLASALNSAADDYHAVVRQCNLTTNIAWARVLKDIYESMVKWHEEETEEIRIAKEKNVKKIEVSAEMQYPELMIDGKLLVPHLLGLPKPTDTSPLSRAELLGTPLVLPSESHRLQLAQLLQPVFHDRLFDSILMPDPHIYGFDVYLLLIAVSKDPISDLLRHVAWHVMRSDEDYRSRVYTAWRLMQALKVTPAQAIAMQRVRRWLDNDGKLQIECTCAICNDDKNILLVACGECFKTVFHAHCFSQRFGIPPDDCSTNSLTNLFCPTCRPSDDAEPNLRANGNAWMTVNSRRLVGNRRPPRIPLHALPTPQS